MNSAPQPVAALTALVPFGLPFFDHPTGGIPAGGVTLLHGEPASARALAGLVFAESRLVTGAATLVISSSSPADWPRLPASGRKASENEAILFAQIPANPLSPADARLAWTEILPMVRQVRPTRLVLFPALAWFEFVPESALSLYAVKFLAALNSLQCETLLTFPAPRSRQARLLISILAGLCPAVIRLQPGSTPTSVFWTTEHLLHHTARPATELDLASFAEIKSAPGAPAPDAAPPRPRPGVPRTGRHLLPDRRKEAHPHPVLHPHGHGRPADAHGSQTRPEPLAMNITLPPWLDMDQPVEAAVAAIVLFLVAGFFLRGRRPEPLPNRRPPHHRPPHRRRRPPRPPAPSIRPSRDLDLLESLAPAPADASEGVPRAAHWSD
ncbi:MAG: hypothetical protein U1F87_02950 [Kiritimatiellia bacterium]